MTDEAKRCVYALQASIRNGFHSVGNAEFSMRCTEMMHVIESLSTELESVKRERDALLEGLRGDCGICAHWKECRENNFELDRNYNSCWEWMGVKEENEC